MALVFYAGHGLQIDGENFLVPIDVDPKREADIPIQAVRLNDVLNTLTSVPSKMRILLLDACRNNPFPELNKTAGGGLCASSTPRSARRTPSCRSRPRPARWPEDGTGANSPYTTALLAAAKEPTFRSRKPSSACGVVGQQGDRRAADAVGQLVAHGGFQVSSGAAVAGPKLALRPSERWRSGRAI